MSGGAVKPLTAHEVGKANPAKYNYLIRILYQSFDK
jgi:hypothetical protein